MSQSQAAANPRHQEEEKKYKINACKLNEQIHETYTDQLSLPQAWWPGDHNAKKTETKNNNNKTTTTTTTKQQQ